MILRNKIRCTLCNTIIESHSVHDFVRCTCGNTAIDGGHYYRKITASDINTVEDLREFVETEKLSLLDENEREIVFSYKEQRYVFDKVSHSEECREVLDIYNSAKLESRCYL